MRRTMRRTIVQRTLMIGVALALALVTYAGSFTRQLGNAGASMEVFLPQAAKSTGRMVIILPGGGYHKWSGVSEGTDWAPYFNQRGIACAVVKYRMPAGDRNKPIADAEAAMRMARDSSQAWHVNPLDVGIMGSSAGGHLASVISTLAPMDVRPNFSILFYPVITMEYKYAHHGSVDNFLGKDKNAQAVVDRFSTDKAVRKHAVPPTLIFLCNDDDIVPILSNGVAYYSAMHKVGNNVTMYAYPSGGHGFGFKSSFPWHNQMLKELDSWLGTLPQPQIGAKKVACIGNSITDGSGIFMRDLFGYPAQLQQILGNGYVVKNFGVGARTMLNKGDHPYMKEAAWRDALDFNPDIAIIKLGTNDSKAFNWKYKDDFAKDMQQMIDSLNALPSHPRIILCTPIVCPSKKSTIQENVIANEVCPIVKSMAKKNHLELLDLHTLFNESFDGIMQKDGIHPTIKGAGQMAYLIGQEILHKQVHAAWGAKPTIALEKRAKEGFQGMAIYGDQLISLQNKGYARLYSLKTMQALTDTFRLGSFGEFNHANVAKFGKEKFDRSDELPLLYVSQCNRQVVDGMRDVCYVERILPSGKATLVQRIVLDDIDKWYGYALQWTIDKEKNLLIGFGNTKSNTEPGNRLRIIVFRLPKLSEGEIVHLNPEKALENYTLQDYDQRYPSIVIGQGGCVRNGQLWFPTGFGKSLQPSIVYVWDMKKKQLAKVYDLQPEMPYELEDIDFYKGTAYIQTNGSGIITLKP